MNKVDKKREIFVYADWEEMNKPTLMGILRAELLRGKEIFSFDYETSWIRQSQAQMLDPDLQYFSGLQYLNDNTKTNFGMFLDSSPDRWGRVLMRRREAAIAKKEGRQDKLLFETDYLLGVFDGHRMGGLRFKLEPDGQFLNDNRELASPPWTSIGKLEEISLRLENDNAINEPDYMKWLNLLVAPGSSLGGARPKASVIGENNQLWIAKFPSKNDDFDVGGWEMVTSDLARMANIQMGETMGKRFSGKNHTFLTKRFDRTKIGKRIHFASAMTLLGRTDGQDYSDGASYLELVEFIMNNGSNVKADLEELWRRIVFNICVSNTDDHLRNHGFLLTKGGWILSPAFDINPNEMGTGLKLNISENDNALELELALEVSTYFRLSEKRAIEIIKEVTKAVKNWRKIATQYGISPFEQELKSRAFQLV